MPSARPRPTRLQIFGERCSGTNFVAHLLRRNLRGIEIVADFGWKHGWVYGAVEQAADCAFVIVHRDPFDWLRSLHQQPWHSAPELRGIPLADFLRTPWRCMWGSDMEMAADDARRGTEMVHERDPATGQPFANVMQLRTAKMRAWHTLQQRTQHHLFVRYEAALQDPRRFVRDAAACFSLRRWPWFRGVKNYKGGRESFRQKAYAPFAPGDLAWIVSQLDAQLERAHGFDVEARAARLAGEIQARTANAP